MAEGGCGAPLGVLDGGGRVAFGLLPMGRFLQGHTYFLARLHEARGVAPIHDRAHDGWRLRQTLADARRLAVGGARHLVLHARRLCRRRRRRDARRLLERIAFPPAVWGCERGDIAGIADRPSRFFRKPDGSHSRRATTRSTLWRRARRAFDAPERCPTRRRRRDGPVRDANGDSERAGAGGGAGPSPRAPSLVVVLRSPLVAAARLPGAGRRDAALPIEAPLDVAFNAEVGKHPGRRVCRTLLPRSPARQATPR